MRDTTALLQRLSLLACMPLLAPGCDDSAPGPTAAQQPKVAERTSPSGADAAGEAKAPTSKPPVGPRVNKAPPPPPLPTDPDELRMMPIEGDPPFIDGYNPEEETCPSGNWCGAAQAALAIAPKAGEPKMELGCPTRIIGAHDPSPIKESPAKYVGLSDKNAMQGSLNQHGTELKRAAGDDDVCCYHYFDYCSGRPLVEGTQVLSAPAVGRTDWADLACPVASPIAAALADAWLSDAAAEHASVAAFGRVALELMAVGAPPALLDDTLRAARDEVRHARACYGMASRFTPAIHGPGPLPAATPRSPTLVQVAVDAFLEGCVGETTAALVAERGAAVATDHHTQDLLAGIAADEAEHAALAWRTVKWALERGGAEVAGALRHAFADLPTPSFEETPDHPHWNAYGRLSQAELSAAAADARREIVAPMLRHLLGADGRVPPPRASA
ncbi:MAG: ferritin-like domain-containing protein [Nannocystaceae bacterium]|nr:ferritin-like domain-containing protein [bacterium]